MEPYSRRIAACQRSLRDRDAGCAVLSPGRNMQYLTGHYETPSERPLLVLVPAEGSETFVAPELTAQQLATETSVETVYTYDDTTDPFDLVERAFTEQSVSVADRQLVLEATMWLSHSSRLRSLFPSATITLSDTVFSSLRLQKDDSEIDALRTVARETDAVATAIRSLGAAAIGLTETELATEIEQRLRAAGGSGVSFEPIVAAGPNGAKPHHSHGDRTIRAGEPVVLDFGTRIDGYPSDQTRTVVFDGTPATAVSEVHEVVLEAQRAAIDSVRPGVTAATVDQAARDVIETAGYGAQFIHRTGHGVGLSVHEPPYITADNQHTLQVGEVFSIEPGIYLNDAFGVRIEDLVVVTQDGCERLNRSPRSLH